MQTKEHNKCELRTRKSDADSKAGVSPTKKNPGFPQDAATLIMNSKIPDQEKKMVVLLYFCFPLSLFFFLFFVFFFSFNFFFKFCCPCDEAVNHLNKEQKKNVAPGCFSSHKNERTTREYSHR